jgi:hypothetical protein
MMTTTLWMNQSYSREALLTEVSRSAQVGAEKTWVELVLVVKVKEL